MAVEKTGGRKRLLVVGLHVLVLEVLPLALGVGLADERRQLA